VEWASKELGIVIELSVLCYACCHAIAVSMREDKEAMWFRDAFLSAARAIAKPIQGRFSVLLPLYPPLANSATAL